MNGTRRSVFRPAAIRRYSQNRDRSVLLRFISPPTFLCLWLLLGLLVVGGCLSWFAQVPVYASGSAVVVDWKGNTQGIRDDVVLVVFVPPEDLSRLQVGQTLFVTLDPAGKPVSRLLIAVEPQIIGPSAAQRQFALSANAARAITQPMAVAFARFEPVPSDLSAATYVGSIYHVDVEVGSRRILSLLPLIGQSFE